MHIADAFAGEEIVRQTPRFHDDQGERGEKFGVPVQKRFQNIGNHMPERAPIIDCRLAASRAPMSLQLRAAIFAARNGRIGHDAQFKAPPLGVHPRTDEPVRFPDAIH